MRWDHALREAQSLYQEARWEEAGAAYTALARSAAQVGDMTVAERAAREGADAWRRADLPARAVELLARVLAPASVTSMDAALASSCNLDAGAIGPAKAMIQRAVDLARDESEAMVARDTRFDLRLALGDFAGARADADWIAALAVPGASLDPRVVQGATWSWRLRGAMLARLEGRLRDAESGCAALAATMGTDPRVAGALAAVRMEQHESTLLRARIWRALGDEGRARKAAIAAVAGFEGAAKIATSAHRRSLAVRATCRASVAQALATRHAILPGADELLAWASRSGLVHVEGDLRSALGEIHGDAAHDLAATRCFEGLAPARARVRVNAARAGRWPLAARELSEVQDALAGDLPWRALADLLDPSTQVDARQRLTAMVARS